MLDVSFFCITLSISHNYQWTFQRRDSSCRICRNLSLFSGSPKWLHHVASTAIRTSFVSSHKLNQGLQDNMQPQKFPGRIACCQFCNTLPCSCVAVACAISEWDVPWATESHNIRTNWNARVKTDHDTVALSSTGVRHAITSQPVAKHAAYTSSHT